MNNYALLIFLHRWTLFFYPSRLSIIHCNLSNGLKKIVVSNFSIVIQFSFNKCISIYQSYLFILITFLSILLLGTSKKVVISTSITWTCSILNFSLIHGFWKTILKKLNKELNIYVCLYWTNIILLRNTSMNIVLYTINFFLLICNHKLCKENF